MKALRSGFALVSIFCLLIGAASVDGVTEFGNSIVPVLILIGFGLGAMAIAWMIGREIKHEELEQDRINRFFDRYNRKHFPDRL